MKYVLIFSLLMSIAIPAFAAERVGGYMRRDGVYVAPHYRTKPDDSYFNNYSAKGNRNPYTGRDGDVSYDDYLQQKNNHDRSDGSYRDRTSRW